MNSFEELMSRESPKLLGCVHCGLCLEHCPTYRMTGDESNSPRGRLSIWRGIAEKRLDVTPESDFYSDECVGCLACQTACPANVPYGEILAETRRDRVGAGKAVPLKLRIAGAAVQHPRLFSVVNAPARLLRRLGLPLHRFLFPGRPAVMQSTAAYARQLVEQHQPSGPTVAFFTGCLMDSVFREINFATVRVLVANNVRVVVPAEQTCCGAVLEHAGMDGVDALHEQNRQVFDGLKVDCVVTNAAGCGLALGHALKAPTRDVLSYLDGLELRKGSTLPTDHIYYDIPCHLYHGQKETSPPTNVFEAVGNAWSLAPGADRCCGSGGTYNITHPENSSNILADKSRFLNESEHDHCTLATANHVCMMQWHSAVATGMIQRPVAVRHLVQVLDDAYRAAGVFSASR